ncbi:MCE family protein [Rhodococcus antarcticus]|uniref:MCE family protein n=1 Tax=Rhodococcus antarcticus TaxID=2987751 RepID=A0ABY6P1E8_9NOCA|nr:MlaD family protein [Rhodococcus antarcticus]UZJ25309.1 MCE family protein [Rhodococcus antarcticus]
MRGLLAPILKLVAFATVTLLATGLLAATIANLGGSGGTEYKARFTDVTGLNVGDDVRVAGVKVGQVASIDVVDRRLAEVSMKVTTPQPLPESSTAVVRYRNIVGQRYVALDRGAGSPTATMKPGETIPLERTKPALDLTVLFNGFKPLFQALSPDDVNQLSFEIIQVFQGESGTIESLLSRTASLTSSIADKDAVIGQLVDNLNSVLDTVNSRDDQLSSLIVSLQQLVSGLSNDRVAIGSSIQSIADLATSTAGLLGPVRGPLQADIAGVNQLASNLNSSSDALNSVLANLPSKLDTITRTASYGSWFQFYLCGLDATVGLGGSANLLGLPTGLTGPLSLPLYTNNPARCSPRPTGGQG